MSGQPAPTMVTRKAIGSVPLLPSGRVLGETAMTGVHATPTTVCGMVRVLDSYVPLESVYVAVTVYAPAAGNTQSRNTSGRVHVCESVQTTVVDGSGPLAVSVTVPTPEGGRPEGTTRTCTLKATLCPGSEFGCWSSSSNT